jgi:uncharacterized protein YgiM (DUF1202 family)
MKRYLIIKLLLLVGLSNSLNAEDTVYVSSKQAKVYKEATFNSDLVGSLKQNDTINLLERKGLWIQVSFSDLFGWTSQYSVTSTKPSKVKVSISERLLNFFNSENKRERLSLVSTAGGIRGFSADPTDPAGKKDFESVGKLESVKVSEAEVENFISSNSN